MPSKVLARTCKVSTRSEDPKKGFQRSLDKKRASEIAEYIDKGFGTIPNSIILSAQKEANFKVVGRGKTIEFNDVPGAFLILDGQHRVYGFQLTKNTTRVPVVIYNGLDRTSETRLFIDINTKQKPVPAPLLLDIKRLAEIETNEENRLRDIFDEFHNNPSSVLKGFTSPAEASKSLLTRVSFNHGVKPLMASFEQREPGDIYKILNSYLSVFDTFAFGKTKEKVVAKPVVFRALMAFFPRP
jgi:DGQHR domain-containing protein